MKEELGKMNSVFSVLDTLHLYFPSASFEAVFESKGIVILTKDDIDEKAFLAIVQGKVRMYFKV
jgi:hypothetical protein